MIKAITNEPAMYPKKEKNAVKNERKVADRAEDTFMKVCDKCIHSILRWDIFINREKDH
jgi:hypothetical protein